MQTAEVVIVGGGVIGASVAYHLAARGCRDVLVLDGAESAGQGSTGRATGGFRAQFETHVNVRLSLLAREKLLRFREETGVDAGFRQCGYLFLARGVNEFDALVAAQSVQRECGLAEARVVSREEVEALNPAVSPDSHDGGVFCPADGFIRPLEILRGYREAAERLGARFVYGATLEGFRANWRGAIEAVHTQRGDVSAGSVVNAAGAWAARVARLAGVELPVAPLRRQVAVTHPTDLLPEEMPMTIYAGDGFHLRVRDGRVLLLWPDEPRVADAFDTTVEDAWVEAVFGKARERVPCLGRAAVDREKCWAGLYEMSPDKHALLGRCPGVENLFLACGSSGHGVMHAPALGHLLAEIMLEGTSHTFDTHDLRPERFAEGRPNGGSDFL